MSVLYTAYYLNNDHAKLHFDDQLHFSVCSM